MLLKPSCPWKSSKARSKQNQAFMLKSSWEQGQGWEQIKDRCRLAGDVCGSAFPLGEERSCRGQLLEEVSQKRPWGAQAASRSQPGAAEARQQPLPKPWQSPKDCGGRRAHHQLLQHFKTVWGSTSHSVVQGMTAPDLSRCPPQA